jgi:hypothetical protein
MCRGMGTQNERNDQPAIDGAFRGGRGSRSVGHDEPVNSMATREGAVVELQLWT